MSIKAIHRCLTLLLAGVAAISDSAFAEEAKLVLLSTAQAGQGGKEFRFELTAPTDRPVYYITDKDTGLALHEAQEQKGNKWLDVGKPWCANPAYPMLRPGKSTRIAVTAPETNRPWRIGIKLYDKKPAPEVKFTKVWSPPVK